MSNKLPRPLSLVRVDASRLSDGSAADYPIRTDVTYVFLGEIPNMPTHCVVVEQQSGRLYAGYHSDNFIELSETRHETQLRISAILNKRCSECSKLSRPLLAQHPRHLRVIADFEDVRPLTRISS
jgi:hypothetical protein